jgi:hypothetical protein
MRQIMMRKTCGTKRDSRALALSMLMGTSSLAVFIPTAQADEVSPNGKGIVGGALLGGEVVTITESLIGVRNGWAYLVGGGLGAAGGAVGGYFVERSSSDGQGATYMLAGGMILIIPAVVLTLNATRFRPSESATEDKPPPGIPPADPGSPGGSSLTGPGAAAAPAPPPPPPPAPGPTSLLDVGFAEEARLRFGLPVPEMRPMYSALEQKTYGLPQHAELRLPVFRLTF